MITQKFRVPQLSAAVLLMAIVSRSGVAAPVNEVEPNDSLASAQNIDAAFTQEFHPDIQDSGGNNVSQLLKHTSISGGGSLPPFNHDYYSFTIDAAGRQGVFDIDSNSLVSNTSLFLFDSVGTLLAQSSGGMGSPDPGSLTLNDPFIEYSFAAAGLYFIGVGGATSFGVDGGIAGFGPTLNDTYTLQASVAVPEPGSILLFGAGSAALACYRRRKRKPGGRPQHGAPQPATAS